jgi:predicted nucleotide-binding protein (sugar kinase/HSP70/actin superfamily)
LNPGKLRKFGLVFRPQPDVLKHFETLIRRIPDNKEKPAAIRERIKMIQAMMAERAKAQTENA